MTRRELAAALFPAAGEEAQIEAKFLLEASGDDGWLREAVRRRLAGEPIGYQYHSRIIKNFYTLAQHVVCFQYGHVSYFALL